MHDEVGVRVRDRTEHVEEELEACRETSRRASSQ